MKRLSLLVLFLPALLLASPLTAEEPGEPRLVPIDDRTLEKVRFGLDRQGEPGETGAESGPYQYPPTRGTGTRSLTRIPSARRPLAAGVLGGLLGGVGGSLVGFLSYESEPCRSGENEPPCHGSTFDLDEAMARTGTGAFIGWSLGSAIGLELGDPGRGGFVPRLLLSLGLTGASLLVVSETDADWLYLPFAGLQLGIGNAMHGGTRTPSDR